MNEFIIKVSCDADNGGWSFSFYEGDEEYMDCNSSGGGVCTSTLENALEMAFEEAKEYLRTRP